VDGVSSGSDESRECMPCGGRGQLISNLGGSPKDVTCPWCSGTGTRQANVDAQASWRERQGAEGATGEVPAEGVAVADQAGSPGRDDEPSGAQPAPGESLP
jgi:hypothetical protein